METIVKISKTLGSFRAENLGDQLFALYIKPSYFPKLLTPIPCLLQGGRGTGKTTVLKSLSYQGQYRLAGSNIKGFDKQDYIGIYYKLETGLVSAFSGANKSEEFWRMVFTHFINLQMCKLLCEFGLWYEEKRKERLSFNHSQFILFCTSIGIQSEIGLQDLKYALELALANLESDVNFASDSTNIKYAPIGVPTRRLIELFRGIPGLQLKTFYFSFDEYENLLIYQQQILNTLVKQADLSLSYKIGVRELGLKTKETLNPNELLVDPADYVLIDISKQLSDSEFDDFAKHVFENRFEELRSEGVDLPKDVSDLFEELSEDQEAIKLGVYEISQNVKDQISSTYSGDNVSSIDRFSPRDFALIKFIAEGSKKYNGDNVKVFNDVLSGKINWKNKVNNYGYASLFILRKKKVGISKYYCGWSTFISLAGGNIRYLLQLVTNSLIEHTKQGNTFNKKISAECQTLVAAEIGRKNILELEGLSTRGAQLMKLVLGLGQIFHEMAVQAQGHAPEITQFEIVGNGIIEDDMVTQVNELLHSAVMHLALIRTSGTKLGGPGDTRDFDYMLHPIFSPFFVYSHRRKRKFKLNPDELLGIVSTPSTTLKSLLAKQNRIVTSEIPEQLQLFGSFL